MSINNKWKLFFLSVFGAVFIALVLVFVFLDDGGLGTKTFLDFVFIPMVSFAISLIITTIISMIAFVFVKFRALFQI